MSEQLSLIGVDPPGQLKDRLFFALLPDATIASRSEGVRQRVCDQYGLRGSPVGTELLHVTIRHVDDWMSMPPDIVVRVSEAAAKIVVPPFEISFNRVMSFRRTAGQHPLVLTADEYAAGMIALQQALDVNLKKAGLSMRTGWRYTPHLTLGYYDKVLPSLDLDKLDRKISWNIVDFALVHSLLGQTHHNHLARWPLKG